MTSINPSDRTSLINGLRALADYLEVNAYAPRSAEVMLVPFAQANGAAREECAVICIDSEFVTQSSAHGSASVQRNFGPVTYKVTLAPRSEIGK